MLSYYSAHVTYISIHLDNGIPTGKGQKTFGCIIADCKDSQLEKSLKVYLCCSCGVLLSFF